MRAQSAIVHVTVRRPNTCEQRHRCQFLPRKCSAICPLDAFPASVGSLLSGLPSNTRVGRDIREHCGVSHSKGRDNCSEQNSLLLRWSASCLSFLICTGMHESLPVCVSACLCACMRTPIRTCMCMCLRTYMHAYARTYMLAYVPVYVHACVSSSKPY